MGALGGPAPDPDLLIDPVLLSASCCPANLVKGLSYTANRGLDPTPTPSSAALTLHPLDYLPGSLQQAAYAGAFTPQENWAASWSALAELDHLRGSCASDLEIPYDGAGGIVLQIGARARLGVPNALHISADIAGTPPCC